MLSFVKYSAIVFQNASVIPRFQLSHVFSYPTYLWSHARRIGGVLLYFYFLFIFVLLFYFLFIFIFEFFNFLFYVFILFLIF